MAPDKIQGWCVYEKVAFTVMNSEQLKRVCENCGGSDTACFSNTETGQTAYGCHTCDHVHKDELHDQDKADGTECE